MRPVRVPIGIGPPNVLEQTLSADTTTPTITDLTVVTAVALRVQIPMRTDHVSWTASIVASTGPVGGLPSTLTWHYAFNGADTPVTGVYTVKPYLTVPGGIVPADEVTFTVTSDTGGAV